MTTDSSKKLTEINTLYEVTKALSSSVNLQDCLRRTMKILSESMGLNNGTVTIVNPVTRRLEIEVAYGMTHAARKRGKYKIGEGITGSVVAGGAPIVVPQISEEPLFLNRTRSRGDLKKKMLSFLCVPIKHGDKTIGALSTDREYREGADIDKHLQFLTIISGLIAQTVVHIHSINEEKRQLQCENIQLKREISEKYKISNIITNSSRMQEVLEMIHRVADSNATVLLRGESGTGKNLVAKAIHHNSSRSKRPLIVVNCSALPDTLTESELFGHERGAFTGAHADKKGRFELAENGTLFLDEIGELSKNVQIKLLNVIQDREFQRLGGIKPIKCNVRLIAATNKNLEKAMEDGSFREDFYYRLNVFPIYLPPLRERRTDILLLAEFFLQKYNKENNKQIRRISTPAIDLLMQYHWPGNIRELQNCIERAVLICDDDSIMSYHLAPSLQTAESMNRKDPLSLAAAVENFERELLVESLKQSRGNQTKAAQRLDTSLRIINYKIRKYGINCRQFKLTKH
ncbi:MAG: sigma 54-interacting transcriptional regulator [Desulfobulbaceae bacterium]|nr:sigma 54-interacting transcriptional regulator [Desulfobulbaceae bacterium]